MIIKHDYINTTDDIAQSQADMLNRQEVTYEYYVTKAQDKNLWVWFDDELYYM